MGGLAVTLTFDLLTSKCTTSSLSSTASKLRIWLNSRKRFVRYRVHNICVYDREQTGRQAGQTQNAFGG